MNFGYLILIIVILTVSTVGMGLKYQNYLDSKYLSKVETPSEDDGVQKGRNEIIEEEKKKDKVNKKRQSARPMSDWTVLICGFLGGAFGLLISYFMSPLIRREDEFNKRRFLIVSIITSILTITAIILLVTFKVVKFN